MTSLVLNNNWICNLHVYFFLCIDSIRFDSWPRLTLLITYDHLKPIFLPNIEWINNNFGVLYFPCHQNQNPIIPDLQAVNKMRMLEILNHNGKCLIALLLMTLKRSSWHLQSSNLKIKITTRRSWNLKTTNHSMKLNEADNFTNG